MVAYKEKNIFLRGYELSWLKRYKKAELILLFIAVVFPILAVRDASEVVILYFVSFVSSALTVRDIKDNARYQRSVFQKIVLGLAFIVPVLGYLFLLLIFLEININNPILFLIIMFLFLGYISVLFLFLLFIINYVFYIILKSVFPFDNGISGEVVNYKLKELSPYMSLPNQIAYLLLRFFYLIIYLLSVSVVFGWIAKLTDKTSENSTIAAIEKWIVNSELISLGNTIGIFSIILTLLTITIPLSYKIINDAVKEFENRKEK